MERINITDTSKPVTITLKSFAVSIRQVDIKQYNQIGQLFSATVTNDSILNFSSEPTEVSTASIYLPSSLFNRVSNVSDTANITHSVFLTDSLFLSRSSNMNSFKVSSPIISASVLGEDMLRGLDPPINLTFIINSVS